MRQMMFVCIAMAFTSDIGIGHGTTVFFSQCGQLKTKEFSRAFIISFLEKKKGWKSEGLRWEGIDDWMDGCRFDNCLMLLISYSPYY